MSRIKETFANAKGSGRGAFIPFITAGDPKLNTTELLLHELAAAGADIIEVGVPFSDPVADGEVIQRASERALRNSVAVADVLGCVANVRRQVNAAVVLFSYFNPLLQFGLEHLVVEAKRAGVDGILVTDLIPEEAGGWIDVVKAAGVDPIFLVAPTTSNERLERIARHAQGFIYAVARLGVTGVRDQIARDAELLVQRVRRVSNLPVAVGFGISTAEQVRQVWRFADGAVVGSAIVREIEKLSGHDDLVKRVGDFARSLVGAA
jgi:tryptophan synthase alpha chain